MLIVINIYKKARTVCKTCYNRNKRKNNNITLPPIKLNTSCHQPNIENVNNNVSTYESHRHVVIGPSNVGKTYYMLKVTKEIGNQRAIHIITRSPNQYSN